MNSATLHYFSGHSSFDTDAMHYYDVYFIVYATDYTSKIFYLSDKYLSQNKETWNTKDI